MKNLKIFYFRNSYSNGSSAQLKAVAYKDGSQVLNGFKLHQQRKAEQKPGILILPAWHGIDKASRMQENWLL
jgi:hypothetical protein